jgi:hypothetical protein
MKKSIHSLSLGLILFTLFAINNLSAQLVPKTPEEKKAVELVKAYQAELEMTVEQASSMYNKIHDNLTLSEEIQKSDKPEEEKKKLLLNLDEQETSYMEYILDAKQFREYKKMKKTLQTRS